MASSGCAVPVASLLTAGVSPDSADFPGAVFAGLTGAGDRFELDGVCATAMAAVKSRQAETPVQYQARASCALGGSRSESSRSVRAFVLDMPIASAARGDLVLTQAVSVSARSTALVPETTAQSSQASSQA